MKKIRVNMKAVKALSKALMEMAYIPTDKVTIDDHWYDSLRYITFDGKGMIPRYSVRRISERDRAGHLRCNLKDC